MTHWICPRGCRFASHEQPRLSMVADREPEAPVTCPYCLSRATAASYRRTPPRHGHMHVHVATDPVRRIERLHRTLHDDVVHEAEVAALRAKLLEAGVTAGDAYDKVIAHLRRVRMTINLPLKNLLFILDDEHFSNLFQLPEAAHEGMPVEKYFHERNASEKTLFGVPELAPRHLPRAYTGGAKHGQAYHVGLWNDEARSTPAERPTYAALNIACYAGGAAPVYGTSYFVLAASVRRHCTFTAGDSLEHHWKKKLSSMSVGTDRCLHKVLLYMDRGVLGYIGRLATGTAPHTLPARYQQYVEAQIWRQLDFDTDVAELVVDLDELDQWIHGDDLPNETWQSAGSETARRRLADALGRRIGAFGRRHGIRLRGYRSGKGPGVPFENAKVFSVLQ